MERVKVEDGADGLSSVRQGHHFFPNSSVDGVAVQKDEIPRASPNQGHLGAYVEGAHFEAAADIVEIFGNFDDVVSHRV
jgi:hypothetical protein